EAARGTDGARHRAPALDHRDRRPHPRPAQGRAARAGNAPRAARARRHLRAPLPHAVRRRAAGAGARGGTAVRTLAAVALALLAGCGTPGYLLRAGWSEARLLLRRQPIARLLARPDLPPGLRERLELVLAVRAGAAGFNESSASFAGHRGAVAFFCAGPGADPGRCSEARRRWALTLARGRVLEHLAARLRRLYAASAPPARRERLRVRLARAAAQALAQRGAGGREDLLPPNNARLLGDLIYLTRLGAFDALASTDADLGPALAALAGAPPGPAAPLPAPAALAREPERS